MTHLNPPSPKIIHRLIHLGLQEDIGRGDLTSQLFIAEDAVATCAMVAREPLRLAGILIAAETFRMVDNTLEIEIMQADGHDCHKGNALLRVKGNARSILSAERTALNFLSYLSGIASFTARCVSEVAGTKVTLLDTRKTLPAYRELAKYAVRCGGGRNHRMRLDDGVMLKDNHIAISGGIMQAMQRARAAVPALTKIEVECDALTQVEEALAAQADVIMLDNMTPQQVREAVLLVKGRVPLEVSGGISLHNLREYAETGVDFISLGALTHSVKAVDIGLDWEKV